MFFSRTFPLLIILVAITGVAFGQAPVPTTGAGILTTPNFSQQSNTGGDAFLWDESALYLHLEGTLNTEEITLPGGTSISGIRGMHMTQTIAPGNATGFDRWIWNDCGVFLHVVGGLTTVEITTPAGTPISNVGGIVTYSQPNINGVGVSGQIMIWNDSAVYLFPTPSSPNPPSLAAVEISTAVGTSISNTRGVIVNAGTSPNIQAYIWNDTGVFRFVFVGGQNPLSVVEITQSGASIANVRGIVSNIGPQALLKAWIWNDSGVYFLADLTVVDAEEIQQSGSSIANVRGLITDSFFSTWMWNDSGVYHTNLNSFPTTYVEVLHLGSSIPNVRGMINVQDSNSLPSNRRTWLWNDVGAFRLSTATTTKQILNNGSPITNVRGMIRTRDDLAPYESRIWMWNDTEVYFDDMFDSIPNAPLITLTTTRITQSNGASLSDVRGIVSVEDFSPTSATGSQVWMWTPAGVFLHDIFTQTAPEITTTAGASLTNTWSVISEITIPQPPSQDPQSQRCIWIRTDQGSFLQGGFVPEAAEVMQPNGDDPIASPSFNAPASAMAIVRTGRQGAGAVNSPAPFEVNFVGTPVEGAVHVEADADSSEDLTSVISGNESQAIAAGGSRSTVNAGIPAIAGADQDTGYAVLLITSTGVSDASFRRGDCNDDGTVNIADAILMLNILFLGAGSPDCWDSCEANDDGTMDITDAIFTIGYLFDGGPPPPDPGPVNCGPDPTVDILDCVSGCL